MVHEGLDTPPSVGGVQETVAENGLIDTLTIPGSVGGATVIKITEYNYPISIAIQR